MKKIAQYFLILVLGILISIPTLAQSDRPENTSFQFDVPQHIQSLQQQIKLAEENEDMEAYYDLRQQIINSWKEINPEVARLYNTVVSDGLINSSDGSPVGSTRVFNSVDDKIDFEIPMESPNWSFDKQITTGKAYDISMDIAENGDIYIAVLGRLDGSTTKDSVYVYKSTDGGTNWAYWSVITSGTLAFVQVELMCLDFGASDNYLLLFYRFDDGWLRVGRRNLDTPAGWTYHTIVSSNVQDFAVDRNYSGTKRVMCVYDSSTYIKSVRSDPTSFGSVWQDVSPVGQSQLVGKDVDFAYGWNGATYATFNGFGSGNLYVDENTNFNDPSSWQTRVTLVQGSTDTTRMAEIIASRVDQPNNQVAILYEKQSGTSYDLYDALRTNGTWSSVSGWVTVDENKWPSLYCKKTTGNNVFRGAFEQSGELNAIPRIIKVKDFNGVGWSTSSQISDLTDVTGLQKPEVGDLDGNTPVVAYVGANYYGVFFDNQSWVTDVNLETNMPENYSLKQNYPNPFNPSTVIRFSVPERANVTLKIFNSIGQEVATLLNGDMSAGNHQVNFNASALSSGIYFYQISSANFTATKKMILIK